MNPQQDIPVELALLLGSGDGQDSEPRTEVFPSAFGKMVRSLFHHPIFWVIAAIILGLMIFLG